jgi:hypothetical protein
MPDSIFERPEVTRLEPVVASCLARVRSRLDDARLDSELRDKLVAYWNAVEAAHARRSRGAPNGLPPWARGAAALFAMVTASEGRPLDELALEGAIGCELYMLSVTLFDAIEDNELEGPMASFSTPVVINAALIIFVQACEGLFELMDRVPAARQRELRRSFIERSMILGRGQHRDLQGVHPATVELAAAQAQEKTEAVPMTAELAALAAGCEPARAAIYARIARSSALLHQCGNDLRDLYGKSESVDLRTGKWTVPLVAHWERASASEREELLRLRNEPGSLDRIRRLVFDGGAVQRVAQLMDRARRDVHAGIEELGRTEAPIAILGAHADSMAARLQAGGKENV